MNSKVTLFSHDKVLIGGLGALIPVAANLLIVENLTYPEADALRKKAEPLDFPE